MQEADDILIQLPIELDLKKSEETGERCIKGYASTGDEDQQGEIILQNGIDFEPLAKSGFINWDHTYKEIAGAKVPVIIGFPTLVEARENGLWVEGRLLKASDGCSSEEMRLANYAWELGLSLAKAGNGRKLAYSIEGSVAQRNGKKIVKCIAKHAALTYKPVNSACTVDMLLKSFCCGRCQVGHPLHIQGHSCGMHKSEGTPNAMSTDSAAPLMLQNLDRGLTSVLYGAGNECGCYDDGGRFKKGMAGALTHMTECLGRDKAQSAAFLRGLVKGATKRPDIMALVKQSGIAG